VSHAALGDATFTACLRFFRQHPLAVRRHYAEHRYGSMVLLSRDGGAARFFVLIMEWDDLFILRHWDRRTGARVEIARNEPVPDEIVRLIDRAVPVPRDGTLLGWVAGHQVRAVLAAHGRLPEPWDDASVIPGLLVLPLVGSQPAEWPSGNPLDDGLLWEYLGQGRIADLAPLVARQAGRSFLVPGRDGSAGGQGGRPAGARVVITERMSGDGFWLPAGVYADQRAQRDGAPVLTAGQLLALPGVIDLAGGRGDVDAAHPLGV
jgi:hypothetical protein